MHFHWKIKKKAEQVLSRSAFSIIQAIANQEVRLPGSTFTPGPIVDETATR